MSSNSGVTSSGLESRIQQEVKNLEALREAMNKIRTGRTGTFDHTIWEDVFGKSEDLEKYQDYEKKAESSLANLNALSPSASAATLPRAPPRSISRPKPRTPAKRTRVSSPKAGAPWMS